MKFNTFCEFFKAIETDPSMIVEDFTIRDYLGAKNHINKCKKCFDSTERVLAKAPKDSNEIGFNKN